MNQLSGTVVYYDTGKGFGQIKGRNGQSYTVVYTEIKGTKKILSTGDSVHFLAEGKKALSVTK